MEKHIHSKSCRPRWVADIASAGLEMGMIRALRRAGLLAAMAFLLGPVQAGVAQDSAGAGVEAARAAPEIPGAGTRPARQAAKFMVAAAHPLAVRAGTAILRRGGSAIDAAIAVQMVLNLVEPQSSGIGGGAFLLHWDARQRRLSSYDGRETAPARADETLFLGTGGTPISWHEAAASPAAVGVPGLLAMLHAAHKAHGRLPWADLFADAIRLARDGFGVSPRLAASLAEKGPGAFSPAARDLFFDAGGAALPMGQVLRNPDLADTLSAIAASGPGAFYSGAIADDILAALARAPGRPSSMSAADLAGYTALARPPLCLPYRKNAVCGMGPPSSGGIAIAQTLSLLEPFDLGGGPAPRAAHLIVEAENLAFADRNLFLADPAFAVIPDGLLDPDYLRARSGLIDADRPMGKREAGTPPSRIRAEPGKDTTTETPGTSHISIVDGQGNAVALTSSIETAFGSGIMVRGFLLNNQLTDFSLSPRDETGRPLANRPQGAKRPRSSMAPTMVFDGDGHLFAVLGSPGGSRIILYAVQALVALLDWDMDPQQAAALPHFGARNTGLAEVEAGPAADALAAGLARHGHQVVRPAMTSGLHIIAVENGILRGGADPRREGAAIGE